MIDISKINIKPVDFYHSGNYRMEGAVDLWGDGIPESQDDPRIFIMFNIYTGNDDNLYAASVKLHPEPVRVNSFEEGIGLCNKWNQEYWTRLLELINKEVIE